MRPRMDAAAVSEPVQTTWLPECHRVPSTLHDGSPDGKVQLNLSRF
jgi:hypothetical protein